MRTTRNYWLGLVVCATLAATTNLVAGEQHGHGHDHGDSNEYRQHGSHVHGAAQLDIVMEGADLYVSFTAPAIDIVGFEHPPKTAEQNDRLALAVQKLGNGGALFDIPARGACRQVAADVQQPWPDKTGHQHDHTHEAKHADFAADYHWQCERPAAVTQLSVRVFEAFPSIEGVDVQFVSAQRQGSAVVKPGTATVPF